MNRINRASKIRPRLLVITRDNELRDSLVTLLTGYNYYVDYTNRRLEGMRMFKRHKHAVAIFDVHSLPRSKRRLFNVFQTYRENPIILIAARREEEEKAYPYIATGCFDILEIPLRVGYIHHKLRRVVQFNELLVETQFYRILLLALAFSAPVWVLLLVLLALG